MKNKFSIIALLIFLPSIIFNSLLAYPSSANSSETSSGRNYSSYIIKLKDSKDAEQLQSSKFQLSKIFKQSDDKNDNLQNQFAFDKQNQFAFDKYYLLLNFNQLSNDDKRQLNDMIEFIEPNYIIKIEDNTNQIEQDNLYKIEQDNFYTIEQDNTNPNDNLIEGQWGMYAVNALKARVLATGAGVKVGIVDTGINFKHRDLANSLFINPKEDINGNGRFDNWKSTEARGGIYGDLDGIDNDGNGTIDDVIGYDFVDTDAIGIGDYAGIDPDVSDEHGHGTAVAGVICAENNNNYGISGVAYNSKLIVARAFNAFGEGESDDIAKAIVYLVNNGAKVINCSFGDKYYSRLADAAIDYAIAKNCVIVTSSGNNNWDRLHYPSDHIKAISVGAVNSKLQKSFVSNYGMNLTLMAPGENILTTSFDGGFREYNGTSLATPFVTGAVAMLIEKNPRLSAAEIKTILELNTRPISGIEANIKEAAGLLDIYQALQNSEASEISISSPNEFTSFVWGRDTNITIIGNVHTPLFDSYEVSIENYYLKQGIDKTYPTIISRKQVVNDTLASFRNLGRSIIIDKNGNKIQFPNGDVIIRLKVKLKNGKTIQRSNLIEIINDEKLKLMSISCEPVYKNNLQMLSLNVQSNLNSFLSVQSNASLINDEAQIVHEYYDDADLYSKYHSVLLKPEINASGEYKYRIKLTRRDGQFIDTMISINQQFADFSSKETIEKPYKIQGQADIFNLPKDLINTANDQIIFNQKKDVKQWGIAELYSFSNNQFNKIDENSEVIFPLSIGKINGKAVVLCRNMNKTAIYESANDKLFKKQIYSNYDLIGLGLNDFDNDGNDELVVLKRNGLKIDTNIKDSLLIMKYRDNSYYDYFSYSLCKDANDIGSYHEGTKSIIKDIDGDGKQEILISNKYGNLRILSLSNGVMKDERINNDSTETQAFQFTTGDIDGDGQLEIVKLTDYLLNQDAIFEYPNQPTKRICKLQVYKRIDSKYQEIKALTQAFTDAKTNFDNTAFRFGVVCGDIDKEKGEEIAVSLYPNIYVIKHSNSQLLPYSYINDGVLGSPIIYDFDKNGKNDIAYSNLDAVKFIEINEQNSGFVPPTRIMGYSKSESEYIIKWRKPSSSLNTQIWINDSLIAESNAEKYILSNYQKKQGKMYLKAIYADDKISAPSKEINFLISSGNDIDSIIVNPSYLILCYKEKVPVNIEPSYFSLIDKKDKAQEIKSVQYLSEREYLLSFSKALEVGDYTLKAESFFDYYSNITKPSKSEIKIAGQAEAKILYFKSLEVVSQEHAIIKLHFSEAVDSTALLKSNYVVEPYFDIRAIARQTGSDSIVVIEFVKSAGLGALGHNYTISSIKVRGKSGATMRDGKANKLSFQFAAKDISNPFIYPNPANFDKDEILYFANLPNRAIIKIYTLEGILLKTINENDGNGGAEWDGIDDKGNRLGTGVYLYQAEDLNGNKTELLKLVIIK